MSPYNSPNCTLYIHYTLVVKRPENLQKVSGRVIDNLMTYATPALAQRTTNITNVIISSSTYYIFLYTIKPQRLN